MSRYIPGTHTQRQAMLHDIGLDSMEALFASVPQSVRLNRALDLPEAMSEMEAAAHLRSIAATNANTEENICFLGAGVYDHYIPAVIGHLLQRQEFYTAYTPYQAELSQGSLQAIFEYQSMICMLTGMDVANASMYDGASALAEAAMMACRAVSKNEILVAHSVHPEYREVLKTYGRFNGFDVTEYRYADGVIDLADLEDNVSDDTAAVIVQTPNFFGIIEDLREAAAVAHRKGALLIASCDPLSLGILACPGDMGADIVVGEGQPLGLPLSYGGPHFGFFASKDALLRKMPGRIVGQTLDTKGRRGFVLTIQAREQHIRREKATSNICTNQALCALAATVYLTVMGKQGLGDVACQCLCKAHYAYEKLVETGLFSPVFQKPFFKEFALKYKGNIKKLNKRLLEHRIIGGADLGQYYPELENTWLVAVTEKRTKAQIDQLAEKAVAV